MRPARHHHHARTAFVVVVLPRGDPFDPVGVTGSVVPVAVGLSTRATRFVLPTCEHTTTSTGRLGLGVGV